MKKSKSKLPSGLFYRKRSAVIWCWYYVKGSNQPTKESTGTTDRRGEAVSGGPPCRASDRAHRAPHAPEGDDCRRPRAL